MRIFSFERANPEFPGPPGRHVRGKELALLIERHPSPAPYVHPISPRVTQSQGPPTRALFAWWGGRHPRIGRGSQTPKAQNATGSRCVTARPIGNTHGCRIIVFYSLLRLPVNRKQFWVVDQFEFPRVFIT